MMKHLKQMACLTLAAVFAAGSCVPNVYSGGVTEVSASEVDGDTDVVSRNLTIGNPMEGHTYKVYQIFEGQVSSDGTKLSNIKNGSNYVSEDLDADIALLEGKDDAAAKAFAKSIRGKLTGSPVASLTKDAESADLEPGYYLVVDESASTAAGDAISDYIVGIVGSDVTVNPKAVTVPDFDKSVDDANKGTVTLKDPKPGESWNIAPVEDDDIDDCENAPDNNKFAESVIDKVKDNIPDTLTKDHPSTDLEKGWYIIWLEDEDGNIIKADTIRVGSGGVTTYDPEHGASTTIKFTDPGTYDIYQVFSGNVGNNGSITNVSNGANYLGSDTVTSYTGAPDSKVYASNVTLSGDPVVTGTGGSSVNLTQGYYVTKYTGSGGTIYDTLVVGGSGGEITLTPNSTNLIVTDPQDGCTYEVYQVFTGWVHDDFTITNPDYGKNYSGRDNISLTDDVAEFTRVADKKVYGKTVRPYLFGEPYTILNTQDPCITIAPGLYVAISKNSKGEVQEVGAVVADPEKEFNRINHDLEVDDLPEEKNTWETDFTPPENAVIGSTASLLGWNYTLDDESRIITLNYWQGGNKDVTVYGYYTIGNDKITYKTKLKSNTENKNQYYMFANDSSRMSVKSVTFMDDLDTSTCTNMSFMFYDCTRLISINFGNNFDTSNVTDMSFMFKGCGYSNYTLDLSHFDTSKVTDMHNMFAGCRYLTTLNVNNFNTSNVTDMGYMFASCTKLLNLEISNFDTSKVTNMNGMFSGCYVKSLNLSNFDTQNVTSMVDMFADAKELKDLNISNFKTSQVTNMSGMFKGCSALSSLDVSHFDTSNVTNMARMFAFGYYDYTSYNSCIKSLDVSDFNTSKVTDMSEMFMGCSQISNMDLLNFNTSNVTNMRAMFSHCYSIENLDLSSFDTGKVTQMGEYTNGKSQGMFSYCPKLKILNLSSFNVSKVENTSGMFYGCTALTELDFSNFDTSSLEDMGYMFTNCSGLTHLDLSTFDTSKVWDIRNCFSGCTSLDEIKVGNKWKPVANVGYHDNVFYKCKCSDVTMILAITPLSLFTKAFAADENIATSITISGEDKTVDYAPGDEVPFKLEATMPESISAYEKYKLVFHDKIVSGLEYLPGSVEVYVDGNKIDASKYTVTPEDMKGDTLTVAIDDVKADPFNAVAGSKVVVKYKTKMTDQGADLGTKNEAYLEYSNDPNGIGTGTTGGGGDDKDVVEVVTFDLEFNKVDKAGDDLDGAGFTLYMEDSENEKADEDGYVTVNRWNINDDDMDGAARFCFNGLKPGNYKLVESRTPDGYNTMEDLIFSIVKDVDEETGIITIRLLKGGVPMEGWTVSSEEVSKEDGGVTYTRTKYIFDGKIINFSGSELPSTGGMGTYLFYIAGAALVILIGAVIVSRKKNEDEM